MEYQQQRFLLLLAIYSFFRSRSTVSNQLVLVIQLCSLVQQNEPVQADSDKLISHASYYPLFLINLTSLLPPDPYSNLTNSPVRPDSLTASISASTLLVSGICTRNSSSPKYALL